MRGAVIILTTILFAACGSMGDLGDLGGLGDILGSTNPQEQSDVRGTVARVDTSDRRIDLNVTHVNNLRDDRTGVSIYYDADTEVTYQGNRYQPTDLEPGDEVAVTGANVSGRYVADRIEVVRNVRR